MRAVPNRRLFLLDQLICSYSPNPVLVNHLSDDFVDYSSMWWVEDDVSPGFVKNIQV